MASLGGERGGGRCERGFWETGSKPHIVKCARLTFRMGNLTETLKGPRGRRGPWGERGIQTHHRLNAPTTQGTSNIQHTGWGSRGRREIKERPELNDLNGLPKIAGHGPVRRSTTLNTLR